MDNRLPNLVNLNEDPQLSEMLLYMIKEGTTAVGKRKPDSSHDIRLSGVLIADDHWYVHLAETKRRLFAPQLPYLDATGFPSRGAFLTLVLSRNSADGPVSQKKRHF